ncbi:SGNH/GDSL hydrolase family protein [Streptomyces sp. NBC_01217]|uniref:SGNH/GDSL hydrolase family protein n=1 Tax=Streptomyces sp. NBC_01217 TaxID=2903779 RepID=UPI002E1405E5|nr:SGNH/GDSL hydrolase family protein [Streptomyces sp. NBC_01217]
MRRRSRYRRGWAAAAACAALTGGLLQAAGPATAAPEPGRADEQAMPTPSGQVEDPGKKLGKGWKASPDRAVTSAADTDGLHILTADSPDAYTWKTAAVLAEPGMPADTWIGNTCAMDRSHVAVAYAPRTFTNHQDLVLGGAFTAVVDLKTGQVTKLPFTASLAYFAPSCNPDTHTAAFTSFRDDKSRIVTVNTSGDTVADTVADGQVTSAVPVTDGTVAARGSHLVHIGRSGKVKNLADTENVPFDIRVADKDQVAFLDRENDDTAHAKLWRGQGRPSTFASGKLDDLALKQGGTGRVFLTGNPTGTPDTGGTGVTRLDAPADADVSSHGRLAVDPVISPGVRAGLERIKGGGKGFTTSEPAPQDGSAQPPQTGDEEPLTLTATATTTGETITQSVPGQDSGSGSDTLSPALTGADSDGGTHTQLTRTAVAASVSTNPVDTDRWCSVPRNDVDSMALQPTPNQVEWAVDMAVRGELKSGYISQGGWRAQAGLGTIDPQGLFPMPELEGYGRIPAQVMLGVLAQESNLWQAESGAVPGQMGNPLAAVAGFYGHTGDTSDEYWKINWDESDCGYGVGQVTDGMRMAGHEKDGETALDPNVQRAVALDYTVNIAASMYILADKWNEIHSPGQTITVNDDDVSKPENWFAALWNYNLGFNPNNGDGKPWGLGWYNNPANPLYPPSRLAFLDTSLDPDANRDAAHPQDWPYEEKVMGWAAWSIDAGYSYATSGRQDWPGESGFSSAGFRPAWWVTEGQRSLVKPPLDAFCNSTNGCDADNPPDCPDEDCYKQYWYRGSNVTWKSNCPNDCGNENIKYQTLIAEPGRGYRLQYGDPECSTTGLPSGALVVEAIAAGEATWSDCGAVVSDGSFQFSFYSDADNEYEAKGDLHQIGGGYGGHFWYTHTRDSSHLGGTGGRMTIDGTWTLGQSLNQWTRVFAHMPDTGAHTQQAHYIIKGVAGGDRDRYINTHYSENTWVDLGVYHFTGTPSVELSNTTADGTADEDIAWDAVAFQPLSAKPQHIVAALGDSYSSGEGTDNYSPESDTSHGTARWNACRRSLTESWPRKLVLPGTSTPLGDLSDSWSSTAELGFVACSGAKTWNVIGDGVPFSWGDRNNYASGEGQFHEMSQVESGVLTPDTTLVTLTIGGNDGNAFQDAVLACYVIGICETSDYTARIDTAVDKTRAIINKIDDPGYAENAQIVLMGYPSIVADESCNGAVVSVLNELADYLRDKQAAMVADLKKAGVKVAYADPIAKFEGHGLCDSDEWINGIVAGPEGEGDFHSGDDVSTICWWVNTCLSRESFHPKPSGTTGYAAVMRDTLDSVGYKGS